MHAERDYEKATERVSFRAGRSEVREIMFRAKTEERSVSSWVRIRLRRALAEEAPPVPYPPSADRPT